MARLFPTTVAITGATGFIGLHVARQLRLRGCEVRALVRPSAQVDRLVELGITPCVAELDNVADIERAFAGCEVAFHAAGAVGFRGDWSLYERVNVEGTRNICTAARRAGVRRLVHTSSIVAVGARQTPTAIDETAVWNLEAFHVPYITTKHRAEEVVTQANDGTLETVIVNPSSVIGPEDFRSSEMGTLCKRFWKGRVPFHFGGGNNYVDVRDVASGHLLAAEKGRPGERYLLTGVNRTYQAFFADLCRPAKRSIPRLRMPNVVATWLSIARRPWERVAKKKPYLSDEQASLMGWFFFFEARKARAELGYHTLPWSKTLVDTHAFWMKFLRKEPLLWEAA